MVNITRQIPVFWGLVGCIACGSSPGAGSRSDTSRLTGSTDALAGVPTHESETTSADADPSAEKVGSMGGELGTPDMREPSATPSTKLDPDYQAAPSTPMAPAIADREASNPTLTPKVSDEGDDRQELQSEDVLAVVATVSAQIRECLPVDWKGETLPLDVTVQDSGQITAARVMDKTIYETPAETCIRAVVEPLKVGRTYRRVDHVQIKVPLKT
ncbi:MAG: hypothetical protein KC416_09890 [Myxococcales bacterium]|nr:hypothetical protein [Myxococcales bacterium]